MKTLLIPAFVGLMAAPAFADAEDFGEKMLELNGDNTTEQTRIIAVNALSGDDLNDRLVMPEPEIASRASDSISAGHLALANAMGVNAADFTIGELSAMFIGKYD